MRLKFLSGKINHKHYKTQSREKEREGEEEGQRDKERERENFIRPFNKEEAVKFVQSKKPEYESIKV